MSAAAYIAAPARNQQSPIRCPRRSSFARSPSGCNSRNSMRKATEAAYAHHRDEGHKQKSVPRPHATDGHTFPAISLLRSSIDCAANSSLKLLINRTNSTALGHWVGECWPLRKSAETLPLLRY